jgi:hypothetical protein
MMDFSLYRPARPADRHKQNRENIMVMVISRCFNKYIRFFLERKGILGGNQNNTIPCRAAEPV